MDTQFPTLSIKRRILITVLVVAPFHFVVMVGTMIATMIAGMKQFDDPDYEFSAFEKLAEFIAGILMQPGFSLWRPWMSRNMPNVVEWAVVGLNSILWGVAIALMMNIGKIKRIASSTTHTYHD